MSHHEPTPDPAAPRASATPPPRTPPGLPAHGPTAGARPAPGAPVGLAVAYELRRGHDGSVVSGHCDLACASFAMFALTTAAAMGVDNPPGPLEWLRITINRVADGAEMAFTYVLTPLEFPPPYEEPKQYLQWHGY